MTTCTVVVAHREAMFAEGIAAALARFSGIIPIASVTTLSAAIKLAERADAAAIDVGLPEVDRGAAELRRRGVRVVFLGTNGSDDDTYCISTHARVAALAAALNPWFQTSASAPSRLTDREREVLTLVAKGLAGKQVARQLGISPKTVERHKTRIFSKLAVPNATAAVGVLLSTNGGSDGAWIRSSI